MTPISRILLLTSVALAASEGRADTQEPTRPSSPEPPYIEATGQGEARVAPDRATLTLVVQTKGPAAAAVAVQNARIQRRVLDTLRALGYSDQEVSTLTYNVGPNYEVTAGDRRQAGYVARNAITVRVAQLDRIGAIIDAALARGATEVEDVAFESSRADSARHAALADASAKARADAEAVARAMGGSLGPLLDASTSGEWPVFARARRVVGGFAGGRLAQATTQITPTAIEMPATIVARWRFRPAQ